MGFIVRTTIPQARIGEIEQIDRHFTVSGMRTASEAIASVRKHQGGEASVIGYVQQGPLGRLTDYCAPRCH